MKNIDSLVYHATLLQELKEEDIKKNLKNNKFKINSYKKGTVIHFEGEACTNLEIILSGEIVVERIDESGGLLTIAEFLSNDIIGGNLLFSKNPQYPMTITSKQLTIILEIDKNLLFELFCKNPSFLRRYLEYVSDHSAILSLKIKNYVNRTIRENVISFLEYERKKRNSNRIVLNMTKKALADKIGVQRTSLSRELSKMKKDGLIECDSESITILKNNESL
jgi:CRP-like cAMP-binding protein